MAVEPLGRGAELAPGYEVIAHMRRGNDLDVYDAWSLERAARCIVKSLRPDRLNHDSAKEALIREGELLERFTHPHIVRAYETIIEPLPAVVIETLTGHTLSALVAEQGRLAADEVGHLGVHLASAVRYMHAHGHLHLDLKPSNVIAEAGRAKLIDLSLARPPGDVRPGIGTLDYLAPEQAVGGSVGPAADAWGLGATLFEAATGEAPFDDDPAADPAAAGSEETYTDAEPERYPQLERRGRRADSFTPVPARLADLLERCLEPKPEQRPEIDELLSELEAIAGVPSGERRFSG